MEGFFYIARRARSKEEVIDLFAARYGWTPEAILNIEIGLFSRLYKQISKENIRSELKSEYNAILPLMYMRYIKEITFTDYYNRRTGGNVDQRPAEDILAEVEEIRKKVGEKDK